MKNIHEELRIGENKTFQDLAEPIQNDQFPQIRDAEFFVRRDGLIVNAEGWYHPPELLIGEVLYAPDPYGNKTIFGERYRKVTLYPNTFTPVPYDQRPALLAEYDPSLDQTKSNPFFARFKQIFPHDQFITHLPSRAVLMKILNELSTPDDDIRRDLANMEEILQVDLSKMSIGITGGSLLGNFREYHDLDIVFQGSTEENLIIAKRMRTFTRDHAERRVIEGGKGWNIRFYNDYGTLMCNFFGYGDITEAPLIDLEMNIIEEDIEIEGRVKNDTHSVYTPTVLGLEEVRITRLGTQQINESLNDLLLVIYHTASRGECFEGDIITAKGALVDIVTPKARQIGFCSIDREAVRNLTPSWPGYYKEESQIFPSVEVPRKLIYG